MANPKSREHNKKEWLKLVDKWCAKHSITQRQAISILFEDSAYNPHGGGDLVTIKDLYWCYAEEHAFDIINEEEEDGESPDA